MTTELESSPQLTAETINTEGMTTQLQNLLDEERTRPGYRAIFYAGRAEDAMVEISAIDSTVDSAAVASSDLSGEQNPIQELAHDLVPLIGFEVVGAYVVENSAEGEGHDERGQRQGRQ